MENKDFKVDVTRRFDTPVAKLYQAWTQPEHLKVWWKPMDKDLSNVVNELKEGGTVRYTFQDESLVIEGTYAEAKENEKLVYSWNWRLPKDNVKDSDYTLTVEFSDNGATSSLHVKQENFETEEGTLPHREGWDKGLDDLDKYLTASDE